MTPTPGQPLSEADVRPADAPCACFGDTGLQASTYHDTDDNERCDLCGGLVDRPHAPVSRPGDGVEGGWIVSNGNDDRWRAWDQGNPIWVDDPAKATRYARSEDAEAVHAEDEDAWCVKPYTNSASDVGEMIRHLCDFQVDSKSGISICTEPTCRKVQRKRGRGMCPSCARGEVRHFSTDDGFWLEIECSAGGANEHGLNGWFSTIEHHPDGSTKRREYVATDSPAYPALTPPSQPVSRPAGEGEREAVARIIDPLRWRRFDRHPPYADHVPRETQIEWSAALQDSLTKADAILSLLRPAAPDAGWRSVKDAPQDRKSVV